MELLPGTEVLARGLRWEVVSTESFGLVGVARSNARNSESMFRNPLPHLLARPCPFERMGVQPIVLRPSLPQIINEFVSTTPRSALEVVVTEGAKQQLCFIEPRGVDRGEATPPPAGASRQVLARLHERMGRVVIVDQVDAAQVPMSERTQLPDVALGALRVEASRFHPSAMNDQEDQDVDRAVPRVIELALRDRAGDRMPDGMSFQDLEVGLLIGTDHPEALPGQPLGVGVAPKDLLGALLEQGVDAGRPPIPRAVRLEIHSMQDVSDRPIADGRDDPLLDRVAGQILARPVDDVQPLGDRLQTSQSNDLSPLEGGKSGPVARPVGVVPGDRASPSSRSDGRFSRWLMDRTGSGWPVAGSAPPRRRRRGSEPVGFDTRAGTDSERSVGGSEHRGERSQGDEVFDHAWGGSESWVGRNCPAYQPPRISCITSCHTHWIQRPELFHHSLVGFCGQAGQDEPEDFRSNLAGQELPASRKEPPTFPWCQQVGGPFRSCTTALR